ncbi:HAD family hydrolase [Salipaludibacillus sp. HK11]|uniref:HAD family hydrolase n=1 Tax=Salipaludibacillus sp. HK11 TaxID=3394320 RepID=UPI0039FBE6E9
MIKAVLFDFDGTLLDRDASVKVFINKQYERLHKWLSHIPKETYISRFIELDSRGYVWKDKVYHQLINEFRITGITMEDLLNDYIIEFKHSCVPFEGLTNMLENLKKNHFMLGMITNGKGQFQMDNIIVLGIEHYFQTILISEWENMKKPNSLIFKKALENLNVLPSESIFVGDHPVNDVKAAQQIGMKSIWKKDDQWEDVEADYIIDELSQIPTIILK